MQILIALSPFIAFLIVLRVATPLAALAAASATSLLLILRMRQRKQSLKILEVGSLVLFAALTAVTALLDTHWTIGSVRLVVDAGLLAIVLFSLAIGQPFTMQYARENVPREFWNQPRFLAVNRQISSVWAAAFAVLVAADAAMDYLPAVPLWIDWAVIVAALAAAGWFTARTAAAARAAVRGAA